MNIQDLPDICSLSLEPTHTKSPIRHVSLEFVKGLDLECPPPALKSRVAQHKD